MNSSKIWSTKARRNETRDDASGWTRTRRRTSRSIYSSWNTGKRRRQRTRKRFERGWRRTRSNTNNNNNNTYVCSSRQQHDREVSTALRTYKFTRKRDSRATPRSNTRRLFYEYYEWYMCAIIYSSSSISLCMLRVGFLSLSLRTLSVLLLRTRLRPTL